jgi:hypothetical protein
MDKSRLLDADEGSGGDVNASFVDHETFLFSVLGVVASALFVAGSFLFYPDIEPDTHDSEYLGAVLFITGSTFFLADDLATFHRSHTNNRAVPSKVVQSLGEAVVMPSLVILADMSFVTGSFLFLPDYYNDAGLFLFIFGSAVLMLPEMRDLHHLYTLKSDATLPSSSAASNCLNIAGLLAFIIGCFLFHPELCDQVEDFTDGGVHLFVFGSMCFLFDRLCALRILLMSAR